MIALRQNSNVLKFSMNFVPLIGVVFYNWSVFALIYSFWLESLFVSFLTSIVILTAQQHIEKAPHIKKSIKYLFFHTAVLLFYLVFILIFIGFQVASKQEGIHFLSYLTFTNVEFRNMLLILIVVKTGEFIVNYFLTKSYKETNPDNFNSFFDARFLMLHFIIILGFFAYQFISIKFNTRFGIIAFALIFVLVKSTAEYISMMLNSSKSDNNQEFTKI